MKARRRRLILAIVATDSTFARGEAFWTGKCIHCNSRLTVGLDGEPYATATIEHIVPQAKGGGDEPENLALACARCNFAKGKRHDHHDTDRATEVTQALQARRRARWRDPETT